MIKNLLQIVLSIVQNKTVVLIKCILLEYVQKYNITVQRMIVFTFQYIKTTKLSIMHFLTKYRDTQNDDFMYILELKCLEEYL